jgi:hypothetical protein
LLALNHFTVPCSFTYFSSLTELSDASRAPSAENKKDYELYELAAPLNKSKGFTRATNATELYHNF